MQRVGWIRMGALGDLLVGLASLREAIDRWPGAKVSVIGPKLWLEILEPGFWPQIDRVVVIERKKPGAAVFQLSEIGLSDQDSDGRVKSWRHTSAREWTLRAEMASGYDVIFNTRVDSPREAFPAFWARVPERWGAARGLERFIYTHRGTHYGKDPLLHERDVPLLLQDEAEALRDAEVGEASSLLKFAGLATRIENSPRIAKWRKIGLPCPRAIFKNINVRKTLLVNPTSSRREKAWPSEKFRELMLMLKALPELHEVELKVLGAPAETNWLNEVARGQFPVVQPANIGELFAVVAKAELLVANTSSVQFIAASTATPVVTLMGRARPEIWGPLGPNDIVVRGVEPHDVESLFERERLAYDSIAIERVRQAIARTLLSIRK